MKHSSVLSVSELCYEDGCETVRTGHNVFNVALTQMV